MDPDEVYTKVCSSRFPCVEDGALKPCRVKSFISSDTDSSLQELFHYDR